MFRNVNFVHLLTIYVNFCVFSVYDASCLRAPKDRVYRKYVVEDSKLCSEQTKRKVNLSYSNQEAVVIMHTHLDQHLFDWSYDFRCTFVVESSSSSYIQPNGLFAVIQNINFRYDNVTNECVDYIQFRSKVGMYSKKFCHQDAESNPANMGFVDHNGKMEVMIFVSKESLKQYKMTDFTLVLTVFKRCEGNDFNCLTNKECISLDYLNDGFVNCPFPGCPDETGCTNRELECTESECFARGPSTNAKVTIGTVTTLVLSFALFATCLWICRKHKKLCWSADCTDPANSQPARVIEMQSRPAAAAASSAPVDADKDLPPSYDSLFPR